MDINVTLSLLALAAIALLGWLVHLATPSIRETTGKAGPVILIVSWVVLLVLGVVAVAQVVNCSG